MTTIKMKKELDLKQLNSYYYEVSMIWTKRKKNREQEIQRLNYSRYVKIIIVLVLYTIFITISNIFWFKLSTLATFLNIVLVLFSLYVVWTLYRIKKASKNNMKNFGKRTLTFDKEEFTSAVEDTNKLSLKWQNTKYVLIGTYSLTFMPKSLDAIPISVPVEYKEEILDALKKENIELEIKDYSNKK